MNSKPVTRADIDAFFEDYFEDVVGVDGSENVYEIIERLAREKTLLAIEVAKLKGEISDLVGGKRKEVHS